VLVLLVCGFFAFFAVGSHVEHSRPERIPVVPGPR
jgi:hypothetical protein